MQSSTPSVRTSLPTTLLYADHVRFHLPLSLGACVLVWSASTVGGFPATDCHWALALFLWLGICRPCAVSPPLTLGAFALATGRLSVSALVCLASKLRKAAPVAMPRALDAVLHAIRQDIPPDSHVVCRQCAVSPATAAGRLCPSLSHTNHPTPRVRGMFYTALEYRCLGPCVPTVSALVCRPCAVFPATDTGRVCACHWAFVSIGSCVPGQQASEGCSRGKCLVHSMQTSTPPVRTSLPTLMLYADSVRFHLPLSLGACVLVWSASAVGGFPATDCHWALALFLWLGICRPCAVSPPLTLGAFALATGRLSVSALVCLVSKLRKAAPVAMPRALDAELHAIRQDIPPDSHVVDPHTPVAGPLRPCTEF